jgi:hypothetical protein
MRQLFLLLSVLLLGLSWAVAQDSTTQPSQGSASPTQSDSTGSGQTSRTGAGHMTVEGCLSGSDGNFTLTDKNGTSYQLTGDTAKLSEHVGHEIKVTGTTGSAGASDSNDAASAGAGAGQTLQVASVKHVAKTCKSGSPGMAH